MADQIEIDYPLLGDLALKTAASAGRGCWTLGCETLDRDYADFEAYKGYIPQLAVGTLRFQAGWAKTEKRPGVYDFAWLDALVDSAISMGMNPLLETGYGNSIYPGGGGPDIGCGLPQGEGRQAYFRWVREMVLHFRGRVRDYAMWNEPDSGRQNQTDAEIVEFNIDTTRVIREELPDARIGALSIADFSNVLRFGRYINLFHERGALNEYDWFIFHAYKSNPDLIGDVYRAMKATLAFYGARGKLRQGEAGCPSELTTRFAMRGIDWSELSQCKWNLRHYITDHAHGVDSSIFTICDFNHPQRSKCGPGGEINRKGLLLADAEHRVIRPKQSFQAMRCMTTLFDEETLPVEGSRASVLAERFSTVFTWQRRKTGDALLAYWSRSEVPGNGTRPGTAVVVTRDFFFNNPVLVDPVTGRVFAIPADRIRREGDMQWFLDLPWIDSPLVIVERQAISILN